MIYWRPIPMTDPARPRAALPLAGTGVWFDRVARMERGRAPEVVPLTEVPDATLATLAAARAPLAGLTLDRVRIMAILNVTPDSFSDGGVHFAPDDAIAMARAAQAGGADLVDVGGESTRPGSAGVPEAEEISRTAPVIAAIRAGSRIPVSIDTRKAAVAEAALAAGAGIVNDVAALTHDPALAPFVARAGVPVILMHHQGPPETMQDDPRYGDVVLDVYDWLAGRIAAAVAAGIARERIVVDPGIGFGKTLQHNVTLIRHLSLYHGLGCAVLLGASRKRFIGTLSGTAEARARMPGSLAVAVHGAMQGVHFLRVHDTIETRQALDLQAALGGNGT
ncbi:MAG: dihydropteroate synthase [Rubellimicrobium sp.]|nr:dihydropteroate synthase [Rubellimicrobium sp.]